MIALIACLTHIGRHMLDFIATTLRHVITTLSLHSTTAGDKGALVLHIAVIEAVLQIYWIRLTLSRLANQVHTDMLTLSVNIVLVRQLADVL